MNLGKKKVLNLQKGQDRRTLHKKFPRFVEKKYQVIKTLKRKGEQPINLLRLYYNGVFFFCLIQFQTGEKT